jgi:hypothetical protein
MKLLPIWIGTLLILCESCTDNELAHVSLINDTDYNLEIQFFHAEGANGYKMEASLDPFSNNRVDMYSSVDESLEPDDLLSMGYDSLIVNIGDLKGTKIFFGKNSEPNYAFNPFKESEPWDYEEYSADYPTNTSPNTHLIHDHLLVIEMDKVISPDPDPAEFEGLTWAFVKESEGGELVVYDVLVPYQDILAYDSASHTYLIDQNSSDRIQAYAFPTSGIGFAVAVDAEIVFMAYFVPAYSSTGMPNKICVEPYTASGKFTFNLGYPGSSSFEKEDLRNHPLIISTLKSDGKLMEL